MYQDEHWDGSGRPANYIDVDWDVWLRAEDRLDIQDLQAELPELPWRYLFGSGVAVAEEYEQPLVLLWSQHIDSLVSAAIPFPDELPSGSYPEGAHKRVEVNRYERDPKARAACLAHWGFDCAVCGFNFEKSYGAMGLRYIHVHYLKDLALVKDSYRVDPVKDLRPVCPNCHAMLHTQVPAMSIARLKRRLRSLVGYERL